MHANASLISSAVAILVVLGIMAFRLRRLSRARPLKIEQLWIAPALMAAVAAVMLWEVRPHPADWPWIALGAAVGGGLGWLRGSLMTITVHPETHAVEVKASPAAILLIVALLAARQVLRFSQGGAGPGHLSGVLIDSLIVFAVLLAAVQRLEMWLRASRLIAAAQAAPPAAA